MHQCFAKGVDPCHVREVGSNQYLLSHSNSDPELGSILVYRRETNFVNFGGVDIILGIRIRIIASRARRGRMSSLATCLRVKSGQRDYMIAKCEFASV